MHLIYVLFPWGIYCQFSVKLPYELLFVMLCAIRHHLYKFLNCTNGTKSQNPPPYENDRFFWQLKCNCFQSPAKLRKKNKVKGKRNRCNMQYLRQTRLYVLVMSHRRFRLNPHTIVAWVSRNSLLKAGAKSEVCVTATGLALTTTYFVNEHSTM